MRHFWKRASTDCVFNICRWMALSFAIPACWAAPPVLHISSPTGAMNKIPVRVDGTYVGRVGDYVQLAAGDHALRLLVEHGYFLTINLAVTESSVRVISSSATPAGCGDLFEVTWMPPSVVNHNKKSKKQSAGDLHATTIPLELRIQDPQFGQPRGKSGCALPMSLHCQTELAMMNIGSVPSGAEVAINGEALGESAPVTLSVPFCPKENTLEVTMRLEGYVNCSQKVSLGPDKVFNASCTLNQVPKN